MEVKRIIILKHRNTNGEIIGYLSQNKKRWTLRSCGIFYNIDFNEFMDKNRDEAKTGFYYTKRIIN